MVSEWVAGMHAPWAAMALILLMQASPSAVAQRRAAALAKRTFAEVNERRVDAGLKRLQWDDHLAAAAREHALNMAGRGFFGHEDPELGGPGERLKRRGYIWSMCAENIFQEQGYPNPVEKAVEGWMSSQGHRQNILQPVLTHSGVGVASTGDDRLYFVQLFAIPRTAPDTRGLNRGRRTGRTTSSSR